MPRIIVIRPGLTDMSLRNAFIGRLDADLNEEGDRQARLLARALDSWNITFVGVSPLKRAISTAWPLCEMQGVSPHPVGGFHGMDLGEWEGKSLDVLTRSDGGRFKSWQADADFPAPGGESMREVYARVFPDLVNIVQHTEPSETVALVLQNAVLGAFCCAALDLPIETVQRFVADHTGYGVFERAYEGGPYRMLSWNQTHHLADLYQAYELEEHVPGV